MNTIKNPKKILIMKFRNIGDVLLTTPLIKNLKLNYPDALIDIAVNKGTQEMVTLNPNINEVIIYDREYIKSLSSFKRIITEIKFALQIRKNRYDIVINTTKGDRGAQIALLSGADVKIGYKSGKNFLTHNVFDYILPNQGLRHTLEMDLDTLRVLDLPIREKKAAIFWSDEDKAKVDLLLKQENLSKSTFIHIHAVSRWMFKCINDKTMATIVDYCQEQLGVKVVLTAAPVKQELERLESILSLSKSESINFAGKFTLKQTAYLNSTAKFFIGVDTAIMHISAANNIPVLAFFGPSGADHWGPWDNDLMESGYTTRRGNRSMGKHRVIQENWDCVPCGKDGCEGSKISDCLMKLDINFIKENIKQMNND
jgi:heptosyltransferase-3